MEIDVASKRRLRQLREELSEKEINELYTAVSDWIYDQLDMSIDTQILELVTDTFADSGYDPSWCTSDVYNWIDADAFDKLADSIVDALFENAPYDLYYGD